MSSTEVQRSSLCHNGEDIEIHFSIIRIIKFVVIEVSNNDLFLFNFFWFFSILY
jgi:hypothetical protein